MPHCGAQLNVVHTEPSHEDCEWAENAGRNMPEEVEVALYELRQNGSQTDDAHDGDGEDAKVQVSRRRGETVELRGTATAVVHIFTATVIGSVERITHSVNFAVLNMHSAQPELQIVRDVHERTGSDLNVFDLPTGSGSRGEEQYCRDEVEYEGEADAPCLREDARNPNLASTLQTFTHLNK